MKFLFGANYWASNAGTAMWEDFDPAAIDRDLSLFASYGLDTLRVFPNWKNFQPVISLQAGGNRTREYRMESGKLPENPYYIDPVMLERFHTFCRIAEKYGMKLIVGVLTGWMSGRTFTPPALENRDLYRDPVALYFEELFIKGFVNDVKNEKAIYAWDLGNECNCLTGTNDFHVATYWTALITNAIRAADPTRGVVSGMHSLTYQDGWRIADQGEFCDVLTTHPYPFFVPHAYKDDLTSFRTLMHAQCETSLYADMSGKPCLVEEIGNLGPMMCDIDHAAVFLKENLAAAVAVGSPGLLWWCGFDQLDLTHAPYAWNMVELELGLADRHGKAKKTLSVFRDFKEMLAGREAPIPAFKEDGVLLVTRNQDQWGVNFMAWCLARRAGAMLRYADSWGELPESDVYLLPSLAGTENIRVDTWHKLLKRVEEGATLYISLDDAALGEFEEVTGLRVALSSMPKERGVMTYKDQEIPFFRRRRFDTVPTTAEVLARDEKGRPAFARNQYGKGAIYTVLFPLEAMLLDENDAFEGANNEIYREVFKNNLAAHPASVTDSRVTLTFHPEENGDVTVIAVNASPDERKTGFALKDGWKIKAAVGEDPDTLSPGGCSIVTIGK